MGGSRLASADQAVRSRGRPDGCERQGAEPRGEESPLSREKVAVRITTRTTTSVVRLEHEEEPERP